MKVILTLELDSEDCGELEDIPEDVWRSQIDRYTKDIVEAARVALSSHGGYEVVEVDLAD